MFDPLDYCLKRNVYKITIFSLCDFKEKRFRLLDLVVVFSNRCASIFYSSYQLTGILILH